MTETDSTRRPLSMPVKFMPYLETYRIYTLFKVCYFYLYIIFVGCEVPHAIAWSSKLLLRLPTILKIVIILVYQNDYSHVSGQISRLYTTTTMTAHIQIDK